MGNRRFRNPIHVGRGRHKSQWNQTEKEAGMSKVFVDVDDDYIYIQMPYDEDAQQAIKEKFRARWDKEERHWYINSDEYTIQEVEQELRLHFPRAF